MLPVGFSSGKVHLAEPPVRMAHHDTAAKVAKVAGTILAAAAIASVVVLSGLVSFGIIPFAGLVTIAVAGGVLSMLSFLKAYWASRTKDDLTFKEYVEQKCPGFTQDQATKLANFGKDIITKIRNGENFNSDVNKRFVEEVIAELPEKSVDGLSKEELINSINGDIGKLKRALLIPVSWYFIRCAFETNQGFEKGMIKFEDPEHKISKYFEPAMYERPSSHFQSVRTSSRGADFSTGLPYIFKHVHMGALGEKHSVEKYSFFKPEQYGCQGEMIAHGLDWVRANVFAKRMGEYDGPNERKEKQIPEPVKKAFKDLCKAVSSEPEEKPETVSEMYAWAKLLDPAHSEAAQTFTTVLDKQFPDTKGYHAYRTGNEVILVDL